jgi:hypothetical protein
VECTAFTGSLSLVRYLIQHLLEWGPKMTIPYLERLRQLRADFFDEHNLEKRQEILDRMLFVLEAQIRARKLDELESKRKSSPIVRRREERISLYL